MNKIPEFNVRFPLRSALRFILNQALGASIRREFVRVSSRTMTRGARFGHELVPERERKQKEPLLLRLMLAVLSALLGYHSSTPIADRCCSQMRACRREIFKILISHQMESFVWGCRLTRSILFVHGTNVRNPAQGL